MNSFTALAYVPAEDVYEVMSALKDHISDIECLQEVVLPNKSVCLIFMLCMGIY